MGHRPAGPVAAGLADRELTAAWAAAAGLSGAGHRPAGPVAAGLADRELTAAWAAAARLSGAGHRPAAGHAARLVVASQTRRRSEPPGHAALVAAALVSAAQVTPLVSAAQV